MIFRQLILLLSFGLSQFTISSLTAFCTCAQFLSKSDCENKQFKGACIWETSCIQPVCSQVVANFPKIPENICNNDPGCVWNSAGTCDCPDLIRYHRNPAQELCNMLYGCGWSSTGTCININCTQINSTSAGDCANRFCGQSKNQSTDRSYPCTDERPITKPAHVCTSQTTRTYCEAEFNDAVYCRWNENNACVDATCDQVTDIENCNYVYLNSSLKTIAQPCLVTGSKCSNAYPENLTATNCIYKSGFTYTWSTANSKCVSCASGIISGSGSNSNSNSNSSTSPDSGSNSTSGTNSSSNSNSSSASGSSSVNFVIALIIGFVTIFA